jgi:hypothetical protein
MNTEQGTPNEEWCRLSEETATKKREKTQRALQADVFEGSKPGTLLVWWFLVSLLGDYPASFDIRRSTFFSSRGATI